MDLQKFLEKRGRYAESSDDDEIIDDSLPIIRRINASVEKRGREAASSDDLIFEDSLPIIQCNNSSVSVATTLNSSMDDDILSDFMNNRQAPVDGFDSRRAILENDWLSSQLLRYGKKVVMLSEEVDFHCLYHAIAYGISRLLPPNHHDYKPKDLRWIAGTYMKEKQHLFSEISNVESFANGVIYGQSFTNGKYEIRALSLYLQIAIHVYIPTKNGLEVKEIGTSWSANGSVDIAYYPIARMFNPIIKHDL